MHVSRIAPGLIADQLWIVQVEMFRKDKDMEDWEEKRKGNRKIWWVKLVEYSRDVTRDK